MTNFSSFSSAIYNTKRLLRVAPIVKAGYWQGVDASNRPELKSRELLNHTLSVINTNFSLDQLIKDIEPDLPWADVHFKERVSRIPLNPPPSEKDWPHGTNDNQQFKTFDGAFSHSYPERYWPRYANNRGTPYLGIRFEYGDLDSLIWMMKQDPYTRQAYLPVWFPEDLGAPITERKPCTLGYQFIIRDDKLHIVYFIRSCDFYRHFRNDIYMTLLLQKWVLDELKLDGIILGTFTMHITSLHLFVNDYVKIFKGES